MPKEATKRTHPTWLLWQFFGPVVILSVATVLGYLLTRLPDSYTSSEHTNSALIYLTAVVLSAASWGLAQGLGTAVIGFALHHFWFSASAYASGLAPHELVKLFVFISASVVVAFISRQSKRRLEMTRERELTIAAFSKLYEELLLNDDESKIVKLLSEHLSKITDSKVYIFAPDNNNILSIHYPNCDCPENYIKCAQQAFDSNESTPSNISRKLNAPFLYCVPMPGKSTDKLLGVLCIEIKEWTPKTSNTKFIHSLADQAALALERTQLVQKLQEARSRREREELRSALLASVTHDLKTPLSSVIGSLSSLRYMNELKDEAREKLITTAHEEANRLDDFISNILRMTKLESGVTKLNKDWHNPASVVNRVAKRLKDRLQNHALDVRAISPTPQFHFDVTFVEQVIQNLLDNAVKYGTQASTITVNIGISNNGQGTLSVSNEGTAIPKSDREKLFDKFYRSSKRDRTVAGTGLGLAICKAIMAIHGGTINVDEADYGSERPGTIFTLTFPEARLDK